MTDKYTLIQPDRGQKSTLIHLVSKDNFPDWAKGLSPAQRAALEGQKFRGNG